MTWTITRMWEMYDEKGEVLERTMNPTFDLSRLGYGHYIRSVEREVNSEKCFNLCDLDDENRLQPDGFCEACHEYPEG